MFVRVCLNPCHSASFALHHVKHYAPNMCVCSCAIVFATTKAINEPSLRGPLTQSHFNPYEFSLPNLIICQVIYRHFGSGSATSFTGKTFHINERKKKRSYTKAKKNTHKNRMRSAGSVIYHIIFRYTMV